MSGAVCQELLSPVHHGPGEPGRLLARSAAGDPPLHPASCCQVCITALVVSPTDGAFPPGPPHLGWVLLGLGVHSVELSGQAEGPLMAVLRSVSPHACFPLLSSLRCLTVKQIDLLY